MAAAGGGKEGSGGPGQEPATRKEQCRDRDRRCNREDGLSRGSLYAPHHPPGTSGFCRENSSRGQGFGNQSFSSHSESQTLMKCLFLALGWNNPVSGVDESPDVVTGIWH